ncbi:biotin--[acetyl-CoA-carboxylase] ligase [Orrella sp. JC864]|uniref:biotin--[acetyl-CoA-carboxylase] ligase n=1 Tax=Orrella sp. JC864 TaxID=3120298 RepID=UPI00300B31A9
MNTLPPAPVLPGADDFAASLRARLPGFGRLAWAEATGSTNADLIALARAGDPAPLPWLQGAWLQESGRGRAGRRWDNRRGDALMFSCAFAAPVPLERLPALSPACGVAICEALRGQAGPAAAQLGMKWPNDIQFGQAKLVGVLVESIRHAGSGLPVVVVGAGINLRNAAALSQALGREVADWSQVCPQGDPAALVQAVAQACGQAVSLYVQSGYAPFVARHAQVDVLRDAPVRVIEGGRTLLAGLACGTDAQGRLQVATDTGIEPVLVGEVSVRPA